MAFISAAMVFAGAAFAASDAPVSTASSPDSPAATLPLEVFRSTQNQRASGFDLSDCTHARISSRGAGGTGAAGGYGGAGGNRSDKGDGGVAGVDLPTCPGDALFAQQPDPPTGFLAYTSEQSANLFRYENISAVAGAITGVRWFGLDLHYAGTQWTDCTETDPTFQITFTEDNGGAPGAPVCSYTLLAQRIPTGILYQGFELNEYRVTLPTSCIDVNGWISIVGLGDPDCWFLWLSSPDGDQHHICTNCQSTIQNDDLSICLLGTPGGVFGACCNQSTGECADNIEINQCATPGYQFTPNATCASLNPPCQITVGACCLGDGACSVVTAAECQKSGGKWLGANTTCAQCPIIGACCFGFTSCVVLTEIDCTSRGGSWLGQNTSCADCPSPPTCPKGSLFAQDPEGPTGFLAGTSETGHFKRWENVQGVAGAIESITWWGLDLHPVGPNQWTECAESDPTFEISFYQDAGGVPGAQVCTYTLLATRTPLNISYLGAELNEYHVDLTSPCIMTHGWVSLVGMGDPACWFLWMSSAQGDAFSWCDVCIPNQQDIDLSICLQGQFGGVLGACCDDSTGICQNSIDISNCTGPNQRFSPGQTCDQLEPPCGVILGACCHDNGICGLVLQSECIASGGNWLGPNTICESCPCIIQCPPGAIDEGEPVCNEGYDDIYNGGCIVNSPAFQPLPIGQAVCGTSGAFKGAGGNVMGDFDWYQIHIFNPTTLTWTARAEFRSRIYIFSAAGGCPGSLLNIAAATECFTYSISANVVPGDYWLIIGPLAFDDAAACGAHYWARATIVPTCPSDVNSDQVTNVADLLAVINSWGKCAAPCPPFCAADANHDCSVNVGDLLAVINGWGPCD